MSPRFWYAACALDCLRESTASPRLPVLAACVHAVDVLGKAMAGLDHAGYLALEATEIAFIFFGYGPVGVHFPMAVASPVRLQYTVRMAHAKIHHHACTMACLHVSVVPAHGKLLTSESCSCFIAQMSFDALGKRLQLASRVAACRVWVALRMKDHVVSGILKSRVQDKHTDSISDKAFEQVSIVLQQHLHVLFAGTHGSESPTSARNDQPQE